jgi:Flp pilus assembly protein TadD
MRRWLWIGVAVVVLGLGALWFVLRPNRNDARLVGSDRCAQCHTNEYQMWRRSQHAVAMQPATPFTVLGRFDNYALTEGKLATKFSRDESRFLVNTQGADGEMHDYDVRYTFGIYPLQQYLVAFPDGRFQALPYAWDSRALSDGGQRWFSLNPGTRAAHTDDFHWTAKQQSWNFMCADCHSTGVRKGYDAKTDRFTTTWAEINVGCEACHGPASEHVKWGQNPRIARILSIGNGLINQLTERKRVDWDIDEKTGIAKRSKERKTDKEIETCATCHSRRVQIAEGYTAGAPLLDHYVPSLLVTGLYYPDGQQRDEVYNYASFLQGRMYHAGVTCSDCHEPHMQVLRAAGNAVCARCHASTKYDVPAHTMHEPGKTGAQCVSCHMPSAKYMVIDARADHSIRIPRPDLTVSLGVPNACNGCHSTRTALWADSLIVAHFGNTRKGFQKFGAAFAADDRNDSTAIDQLKAVAADSTEPMIVRASALARLGAHPSYGFRALARATAADPNPLVRRSTLTMLDQVAPKLRVEVAAPLLDDESRAVRIEAARVLAPVADSLGDKKTREKFTRAAADFVASQQFLGDRPEARDALGIFYRDTRRTAEAEAEFRAALRLAPHYSRAYVNLADLLRAQGRETEVETVLREGIAAIPNDATLHHSLGLSLVRSGNLKDAIPELQRAMRLEPNNFRFLYVYATALHEFGNRPGAMRAAGRLVYLYPKDSSAKRLLQTIRQSRPQTPH